MLKPPSSIIPLREGVKGTLSSPLRSPAPGSPAPHKSLSRDSSFLHLLLGAWSRVRVPGIACAMEMGPEVEQSGQENREGRKHQNERRRVARNHLWWRLQQEGPRRLLPELLK